MNCYNGQEYLKDSLNSVINQTYKNWELIFYDNCSNDKVKNFFLSAKKIIQNLNILKVKKEKIRVARYNVLKKIKGSFFYFLIVMIIYYHQNLNTN